MSNIKLFENKKVRSHYDAEAEKWYFSIVDIIEILTDSPRPRKYWNALKTNLNFEGSELSQKLGQLKMQSEDGKYYLTDVGDTEQLLRLIQSIPSPKAEPFKQWLAKSETERERERECRQRKKELATLRPLRLTFANFALKKNIVANQYAILKEQDNL